MSLLKAFQGQVVGFLAATDSLFATKYISGRVESAMYLISARSFWYSFAIFWHWLVVLCGSVECRVAVVRRGLADTHINFCFLTTYCMALGCDAWIAPSGNFLMVHPRSCVGSPSCLMLHGVVRMAVNCL